MDQKQLQQHARYMLDTRTVNTIEQYLDFHWDYYWWRILLWTAALAVVFITTQTSLILFVLGFCIGWVIHHLQGLSGLAQNNEVLDYFVDWPKVEATAAMQTEATAK